MKTAMRVAGVFLLSLSAAIPAPWAEVCRAIGQALVTLTINVDPTLVKATDLGAMVAAANKTLPGGSELHIRSQRPPPPPVVLVNTGEK